MNTLQRRSVSRSWRPQIVHLYGIHKGFFFTTPSPIPVLLSSFRKLASGSEWAMCHKSAVLEKVHSAFVCLCVRVVKCLLSEVQATTSLCFCNRGAVQKTLQDLLEQTNSKRSLVKQRVCCYSYLLRMFLMFFAFNAVSMFCQALVVSFVTEFNDNWKWLVKSFDRKILPPLQTLLDIRSVVDIVLNIYLGRMGVLELTACDVFQEERYEEDDVVEDKILGSNFSPGRNVEVYELPDSEDLFMPSNMDTSQMAFRFNEVRPHQHPIVVCVSVFFNNLFYWM